MPLHQWGLAGPLLTPIIALVMCSATPLGAQVRMSGPATVAFMTGSDDVRYAVYEVELTNYRPVPILLTHVSFHVDSAGTELIAYPDTSLSPLLQHPGQPGATMPRLLPSGALAVLFAWVPLPAASVEGLSIWMRVDAAQRAPDGSDAAAASPLTVWGAPVRVLATAPRVLGTPLRGGPWLAGNGPSATSAHRTARFVLDTEPFDAQRFAIDWVKLNAAGRTHEGDSTRNESYFAYGAPLLAMADGVVLGFVDTLAQNVPQDPQMAIHLTRETVAGNRLLLKVGDNAVIMYAHLQPRSVRVKAGQKVKRGEVLALLGNSGNSSEPHLHVHLADAGDLHDVLSASGLPYAMPEAGIIGHCASFAGPCTHLPPRSEGNAMPLENDLVEFP